MGRRLIAMGFVVGCGGASGAGPYFDDDKYLVVGVDPDREANALVTQFGEAGHSVERRLSGLHFTALGFVDGGGAPSAVRVVTRRGIALSLGANDPLSPDRPHLMAPPRPRTHDADGDGFDEVFIERDTGAGRCVEVYRVRDSGFVDAVPTDQPPDLCPTQVADLDGDGRIELLILLEPGQMGFDQLGAPIRVPLWPRAHRYVMDLPAAMRVVEAQLVIVGSEVDRSALVGAVGRAIRGRFGLDSPDAGSAAKHGSAEDGQEEE